MGLIKQSFSHAKPVYTLDGVEISKSEFNDKGREAMLSCSPFAGAWVELKEIRAELASINQEQIAILRQ